MPTCLLARYLLAWRMARNGVVAAPLHSECSHGQPCAMLPLCDAPPTIGRMRRRVAAAQRRHIRPLTAHQRTHSHTHTHSGHPPALLACRSAQQTASPRRCPSCSWATACSAWVLTAPCSTLLCTCGAAGGQTRTPHSCACAPTLASTSRVRAGRGVGGRQSGQAVAGAAQTGTQQPPGCLAGLAPAGWLPRAKQAARTSCVVLAGRGRACACGLVILLVNALVNGLQWLVCQAGRRARRSAQARSGRRS